MLLDEPSLGLSPKLVKEIFDIIVRINRERGVTILLVEQNANMALQIADYGYVLEVGRIVMADTCARLLEKDDIKEFYLGVKEHERPRQAALEEAQDMALTDPATHRRATSAMAGRPGGSRSTAATPCPSCSGIRCRRAATARPCARSTSASGAPLVARVRRAGQADAGWAWSALGLQPRRRGLDPGRDNCPEWLYADMGIMGAGGVTNGIYTTDSAKQVEYILNDSGTRFLFVENEEQLDKILEVRERCPHLVQGLRLRHGGPARLPATRRCMPFDALLALGRDYDASHPGPMDRAGRRSPSPRSWRILVYTSGTTGPPKGAML